MVAEGWRDPDDEIRALKARHGAFVDGLVGTRYGLGYTNEDWQEVFDCRKSWARLGQRIDLEYRVLRPVAGVSATE